MWEWWYSQLDEPRKTYTYSWLEKLAWLPFTVLALLWLAWLELRDEL